MRWMLALAVLLAGCDQVFGLERDPVPDSSELPAICPAAFNGQRYLKVETGSTWDVAQAACRSLQVADSSRFVHLAVIGDDADNAALRALVGTREYWVGYTNRTPPAFLWVTDEPSTVIQGNLWAPGQPDTSSTLALCARMVADGLHDQACTEVHRYLCECDEFPVTL